MSKLIKFLFFSLIIASCNKNKSSKEKGSKEIEIGILKIGIPTSDKFVKGGGIDSYVAYIVNVKRDTFHIEYGGDNIIYDLFDVPPKGFPLEDKEKFQKQFGKLPSPDEAVFTSSPEVDNLQNIFQKNFYLYDTINNLTVKIVQPKRIGEGMTGLYIPRLRDGNSFSIYAKNLDSTSHRNALTMFETISYK